ncbi:MAG: hypothetical protein OQK04_12310 [Kangiellaceae bacterium]|nr:hypothetical protein [Kangiellaceae bacterium]MCW8999484.1 hypothetical protein [Kangiellaceae bacterium]
MDIKFREPNHGWLPVEIEHQGNSWQFDASDVPLDPIHTLVTVLNSLFTGRDGEVWWHLEPDGYFLSFKAHDGKCTVRFDFSDESRKARSDLKFEFDDSIENIVVPLWREVKKFYSYGYCEPHWPPENKNELKALSEHVKKLQNKG